MTGDDREVPGIGLTEAIQTLRAELLAAQSDPGHQDVQFPIQSITIELQVAATRSADGKAGFKVPFINAELGAGAGWQKETLQAITVVFDAPVDRTGNPIKVVSAGDQVKG
ncbi:hypothetical protein DMH25_03185 [Streptomyces sp. WAC 01325]|uniref:Trypsin-co-occurring domain-containing protein n=1 Tax=Streptomyces osmaniensis TaxID=593134 RepID=A0ABP6W351_9ACTN|nr:trypco2 family protein [Streptomyces sp. WAC 01325]QWA25838.1 hypothetical protein KJK32_44060 [Streptomyces sp. JCM17656]RSN17793.1 hypothetical protein DMH25_03185 [Streptomyces sp. WAC 01325]